MMTPIRLKITHDEFYVISQTASNAHSTMAVNRLRAMVSLQTILLAEWSHRSDRQQYTWACRNEGKEYAYSLPNSTALALHQLLCLYCPNHAGQTLLEKLNLHIVNAGFKPETVEYQ